MSGESFKTMIGLAACFMLIVILYYASRTYLDNDFQVNSSYAIHVGLFGGLLFLVLSSHIWYKLLNFFFCDMVDDGHPTSEAILLFGIIFGVIWYHFSHKLKSIDLVKVYDDVKDDLLEGDDTKQPEQTQGNIPESNPSVQEIIPNLKQNVEQTQLPPDNAMEGYDQNDGLYGNLV
jgi:hypothetical protein